MALPIRKAGGRYADANLPHPSHNLPAGVIHEFITHLCYLALRFLPASATAPPRVAAAWSKHGDEPLFKYDDLDALVIAGRSTRRIRFTSHAAPDCFTVTVRGTKGWAETDLFQPHLRVVVPRKGGQQLSPLVNQFVNGAGLVGASVRGLPQQGDAEDAVRGAADVPGSDLRRPERRRRAAGDVRRHGPGEPAGGRVVGREDQV